MDPIPLVLFLMIAGFVFSLMLSAFFSSSETALTAISKLHAKKLQNVEEELNPLDVWIHEPNRILATLLVGNNIANVAASVLAAFIVKKAFEMAHYPNEALSGFIAFVGTTSLLLIFGEIIPKIYAKHHAETLAPRVIGFLNMLYSFPLKPVIRFFLGISNGVVRLFGGEASKEGPFLTESDILTLIEVSEKEGVLEEEEREMINSIIEFGDTIAKEIMVPRTDMVRLSSSASLHESLQTVVSAGHSRIPVYDERIDNIIGILYAKDLLAFWRRTALMNSRNGNSTENPPSGEPFDVRRFLRPATFVPETKRISELLREFQRRRFHMAIVVDEYGGTAGLVTIEDVIEEIVGEIHDEYDSGGPMFRKLGENSYEVSAKMPLSELSDELEIDLPEGEDFETISGFVCSLAGHVPAVGEVFEHGRHLMTVIDGDERRVTRVRIDLKPERKVKVPAQPSQSSFSDRDSEDRET